MPGTSNNNSLQDLLIVYLLWNAASVVGTSFIYLYFKNSGLGFQDLVTTLAFWSLGALAVMLILNKRKTSEMKLFMLLGILFQLLAYLLVIFLQPFRELLFTYSFLFGTASFLFWVPFNILFFEFGKDKMAWFGSIYFSVNPMLAMFLPVIAGIIAQNHGFSPVFGMAGILYVILFAVVLLLVKERVCSYDIASCLAVLKGFKTLVFIEGIYGGGMAATLLIIPLFYFTTPQDLGVFLSVTTIFSVVASFMLSKFSDKSGKRKNFIILSGSALGITTAVAAFATTAIGWVSIISVRNFFATLFYPFTTTIIMDNKINIFDSMIGREWLLNLGRFLGVIITLAFIIFFSDIHFSLLFFGILISIYPIIIELKKKHIIVP